MSLTEIGIGTDGDGATRVRLRSGMVACRLIGRGDRRAEVALLAGAALLLGGDEIIISVEVGPGCSLRLTDVGGTVAYDGAGRSASWEVRIRLAEDATLAWDGLPLVVADGADLQRRTTIDLGHGSSLRLRETVVWGRSGERGGRAVISTEMYDRGGPVLVEQITASGSDRVPGVLGEHRVLDSLLCRGTNPLPESSDLTRLELERGGSVLRWLGDRTHRSPLAVH